MQIFLEKENCFDVIEKEAKPTTVKDDDWKAMDKKARFYIVMGVEANILVHIKKTATAREAWSILKKYFVRNTLTAYVRLARKLFKAHLEIGGNMEAHLNQMFTWFDELNELSTDNFDEKRKLIIILSSLNEEYDTLITALEARNDEDLTVELVRNKLLEEWEKKKSKETATALKVYEKKPVHVQKKKCFFCKKEGHIRIQCEEYKKWRASEEKSKNWKSESEKKETAKVVVTNNFAFSAASRHFGYGWFIDSGATVHICNDSKLFSDIDFSVKQEVFTADGKSLESKGAGTVQICAKVSGCQRIIPVQNVLFVPEAEGNLLSVRKLTDKGYKVNFSDNGCDIVLDDKIVGSSDDSSGLFRLMEGKEALLIAAKSEKACVHEWHRRLAHRDINVVKQMEEYGIKFAECNCLDECESCLRGKLARKPFPKESKSRTSEIFELVHSDVAGPFQVETPSGNRYFVSFIDDFSRYSKLYLMRNKSEVEEHFKAFVAEAKTRFDKKPKILRSDQGGEYTGKEFQEYLKVEGIQFQHTVPYTPQQNGVAERRNRYLVEAVRCMLIESKMNKCFWGEAVLTANHIQNRVLTRSTKCTPFELLYGEKPTFQDFHTFGEEAMTWIPKEKRKKLDDVAIKLRFVGYDPSAKALRLVDTESRKVTISRDVIFVKSSKQEVSIQADSQNFIDLSELSENTVEEEEETYNENSSDEELDESSYDFESANETLINDPDITVGQNRSQSDVNEDQPRRTSRSNAGVPPQRFTYDRIAVVKIQEEPRNYFEAMKSPDKDKWLVAMQEELKSMETNKTWELVPLPKGKKAIGTRWVFKIKRDENGKISRYRARLVAQGYSQKYGEDYDEVFAPTARITTFRMLLSIAAHFNMQVKHYDVKTAFLNGEIEEEIYLKQPPGFEVGDEACHLFKCIYGLKQAARCWNKTLIDILLKLGFKQSRIDPCLFTYEKSNERFYILVHVDDYLMICKNEKLINEVAKEIRSKIEITDLGDVKHFLGIKVERDKNGDFFINQQAYIEKIVCQAGLTDAKVSKVPLDPGYDKLSDDEIMESNKLYQKLIGLVLYVSTNSRPDISAAVSILSQKITAPTKTDFNELKRVIRYLNGTKAEKLRISCRTNELEIIAYSDANWAENRTDRKSNTGYLIKFGGGTVSWASRKQSCVALSTCESEYIALAETSQEVIWLRNLCKDLACPQNHPVMINEDNQSCLKLVENQKFSNRTKHIDTKYHFIRDLKAKDVIKLQYCQTDLNVADLLTKPLGATKIQQFKEAIGLTDAYRGGVLK